MTFATTATVMLVPGKHLHTAAGTTLMG